MLFAELFCFNINVQLETILVFINGDLFGQFYNISHFIDMKSIGM